MHRTILSQLRFGREIGRERPMGDHVPYTAHVDAHTVATRDGYLVQGLVLEGLPAETMDSADLHYRKEVLNTLWRSLASSRFALVHHVIRRRVRPDLGGVFANPFCAGVDQAWRARMGDQRLFVNEHVLWLVRRPLRGAPGRAEGWLRRVARAADREAERAQRAEERKALEEAMASVLRTLEPYGARRLGVYEIQGGHASSLLERLSYLLHLEERPVRLSPLALHDYLPCKRLRFGRETLEIRGAAADDLTLGAIVGMKEYAPETVPGLLDPLLRIPHEFVLTESFAFVDRQRALGALTLQERQMRNAEDEAWTLRAQLEQARDHVASGQVAFGEHHLSVLVRGATRPELDAAVSSVVAEFTNQGILAVREDLNLQPAFFAQLPGNFVYIGRRALISSANFAGFASFHGFPRGRMAGNHWGSAVTLLETSSATPYAMSFHHGDLGNFTVIGPSGSGKTVVLGFLLAQAQRFSPRTVFFDKDRGAEIALRAMGGRYRLLRPGETTGMNPLALPDTPANRAFLRKWLALLVRPQDGSALGAQDRAVIAEAVDASYRAAPEFRQLAHVQELLRGHERGGPESLSARLAAWWGSGDRAWLFDHKSDDLSFENPTLGFDLTHLLADPIGRAPALAYLFHRVDGILDGRPTLLFLDEGWHVLDDPLFAEQLRDWLKTVRKRNGVVGFGSQSASDALGSRVADAIREQCPTQIFFPNPKAAAADHCGGFGLTARELEIVRTLPDTSRAFLLKQGTRSVAARLDLTGLHDLLAVLSGREQTVTLLDAVRVEVGDDPAAWLPVFLERVRGLRS